MSFFNFALFASGKQLKKAMNLLKHYGLLVEIQQYQTRNNYIYARLSFSQSGIFAFIEPRCRSPPPSFRFQQTQNRKDGKTMKTINLKDYYPCYTQDTFVEVPDELLAIFEEYARAEAV